MRICAALMTAGVLLGGGNAVAGPIVDAAQRSEALLSEGKPVEALAALDQAVDAAWEASPLVFRKAILVEESSGFARYTERPDNRVRADDRVTIYSEPVGFTYKQQGDLFSTDLAVDLTIENATGQILVDVKDIFAVRTETRDKQRQFFLGMSHVIPYIRPGDYLSTYTVRDRNSAKTGSFQIPITVVAGESPAAAAGTTQIPATPAGATPAGSAPSGAVPAEVAPAPAPAPANMPAGQGG